METEPWVEARKSRVDKVEKGKKFLFIFTLSPVHGLCFHEMISQLIANISVHNKKNPKIDFPLRFVQRKTKQKY